MKQFVTIATCLVLAAISWRALAATSPVSPEDERASFQLADTNLVVELVAAEPDVRAPVAIAWDANGRMFVAEMTDYPSGPVNGRIRLLEDRDGDGRYERATVFATNLAFPNGVMAWKNGVLVTAAPDIWFLADTNADGVADVREKILTGFSEGNQQLRVNGLYWGIDNWIYGCNGRSDGEVKWADGTPAGSIRRHDFRFRPDRKQFEVIAGNSQFGMGHDDWGNRFPVFNNTPIRHVVMEDRYLEGQPLLAGTDVVPSISPTNDGNRVFALTPPTLLIPQPVGFFTSACGPSIFRGTALPESYRGNYFVCEPVQNVVQRRVLRPSGSTFTAEYAHTNQEFLASTDRWFHGVFTATGPDGAFYIVDFYRDLVEHPHWVAPEIRDKIDWRKGEEHGRIWRVRSGRARLAKVESFSTIPNNALVEALENANGWARNTAQRLLVERNATNEVRSLETMAARGPTAAARVHALRTLEGLGVCNSNLLGEAMQDAHPRVREQAVAISEPLFPSGQWRGPTDVFEVWHRNLLACCDDPDARVRLQAAWLWSARGVDDGRISALARVVQNQEFDVWQSLPMLAASKHPWALLEKIAPLLEEGTDEQLRLLAKVCALVVEREGNQTDKVAAWLAGSRSPNRFGLAAAFLEALPAGQRQSAPERLGGVQLLANATSACTNGAVPLRVRLGALRLLAAAQQVSSQEAVQSLLKRGEPEPLQMAAVKLLMEATDVRAREVLDQWPALSRSARRQVILSSLKNANSMLALLDFVESGRIPKIEMDPSARQTLQKHANVTVASRAKLIFDDKLSADRDAAVQKFRAALKLDGDRKHGAGIFERTCSVCHQIQGVGAKVGPDLSGIGQHARETLLVDILDPSRQVLPDFVAYNATTKSGDSYTGFIANESATTVTLRRANEPDVTLKRTELQEFKTSGQSLMPDGLEAGLSEQDMADLIEFLRRPDRTLFTQSK